MPSRKELIQALLDSTNLPLDLIQHLIVPAALYLPSADIARSKFNLVVHSLKKLQGVHLHLLQ